MIRDTEITTGKLLEVLELSATLGGQKVLEIPYLQVYPNEVLVIIGPNGSGKTTLLLCLALLLKPATGTLFYHGMPVTSNDSVLRMRRKIAVVFQESLLLSSTVWDNVALGLRLRGVGHEEIRIRVQKWLERFGVASLAQRQGKTLSGGEAKRVSLARAFALQPEVLFLDEPFNALDSPTRQAIIEDFDSVLRDTKVSTIMVTHDRNEAVILASRVGVLMNGNLRQIGYTDDVFSSPVDEEVARFIEAGNILHGTVTLQNSGLASINVGEKQIDAVLDLPAGNKVTIFLHQEDITISLPTVPNTLTSARNNLAGKIIKIFPQGSQMRITVDCSFPLVSLITKRSLNELGLVIGREVLVSFKASSIHFIQSR